MSVRLCIHGRVFSSRTVWDEYENFITHHHYRNIHSLISLPITLSLMAQRSTRHLAIGNENSDPSEGME